MAAASAGSASITDRIEHLRALDGARRSVTPPAPRSAKIELTSRCNYDCCFCASHLRGGRRHDMAWPLYVRVARELREAGVEQLGLFYIGESLLYPRLEDAVRHAKDVCGYPYVFLTTNGSLATRERVLKLMEAGLDSLKFAMNFADPQQIERGAGVEGETCARVVRNVLDACDERDAFEARTGRRCTVSASSLRYDDGQDARMARLLDTIGGRLDQHYWLPMYGSSATWRACAPAAADAPVRAVRKPLPCWPLFTEAHVTADGRLSACSLDHAARFHMADLNRCSFNDAWHAPAFRALREAHLRGDAAGTPCERCIAYAEPTSSFTDHLPELPCLPSPNA